MTTKQLSDLSLSVLDLVPVLDGKTPADSFHTSLDLARNAEKFGYERYWFAEHHNSPGVASSATALLIGYVAGGTEKIRVGSGGIMLPNHVPLVVAEQFGTLESLYPGRIDLGLGRAPGTDQLTARALRRNTGNQGEDFPENVVELRRYLSNEATGPVGAYPGQGLNVPIWLLGSSLFSARLAGMLGLPYAFASHFAPTYLHQAIKVYKESFQPSEQLKEPYVIACVNVIAADTDEEAARQATTLYQFFLNVVRGGKDRLKAPVDEMDNLWNPYEKQMVMQQLHYTFIGGQEKITRELQSFLDQTGVDEIMACAHIFDHSARVRSYEILAEAVGKQK